MKKLISILLPILFISPVAFAKKGHDGKGPRWIKKMDLSEAELAQIKSLMKSSKETTKTTKKQVKSESDLLEKMVRGSSSESELRKQYKKIDNLRTSMANNRFENMLKIRKIIPENKRQYMRVRLDHKRKRGKHKRNKNKDQEE